MWLNKIWDKMVYETELVTQLVTLTLGAGDYGLIEAKWIPTDQLSLPILHQFSYYHVAFLFLMAVISFALALAHVRSFAEHKKKYIGLMCMASLPLALMIEDISWFITKWQPIKYNEWTCIRPGWCVNFGFSYIPFWYFF